MSDYMDISGVLYLVCSTGKCKLATSDCSCNRSKQLITLHREMSRKTMETVNGADIDKCLSTRYATKKLIESLLDAAIVLAKDTNLTSILEDIDKIPDLREGIRQRDEQLKAQDRTRRMNLNDYSSVREKLTSDKNALESSIAVLQKELQVSQTMVENSKVAEKEHVEEVQRLKSAILERDRTIEQIRDELERKAKAIDVETENRQKWENQCIQQVAIIRNLKSQITTNKKAHEELERKAIEYKKELDLVATLTVDLNNNLQALERLENVWQEATTVVFTALWRNIDFDSKLNKDFCMRLQKIDDWSLQLPMPQTNTDAAKQMRCVVILAYMARIFANSLFQPTYHLPEDSGIRELLIRQAEDQIEREAAFRKHLQALLPKQTPLMQSQRVEEVCRTVMTLLAGFLPKNQEADFLSALKKLAHDACDTWREISCFTHAVEPRFNIEIYSNWYWDELTCKGKNPTISKQVNAKDQPLFTVFPRIYVYYRGEHVPETHGVLFMESQARAANEEVKKSRLSLTLEKPHSVRNRLSSPQMDNTGKGRA